MSTFEGDLKTATGRLPVDLQAWMRRAIDSGWFDITSGDYDSEGGGRCPVGAAATMAGAWVDGGIAGKPDWGTPQNPGPEVEDFAAYFDLVSDDIGVHEALTLVRQELDVDTESITTAA